MRKLILALSVLALISALFLVGCGGDEPADEGTTDAPATEQPAEPAEGTTSGGGAPTQPAGHTGWWAEGGELSTACTSCHAVGDGGGGGPAVPDSHLAGETLDTTREVCIGCHLEAS